MVAIVVLPITWPAAKFTVDPDPCAGVGRLDGNTVSTPSPDYEAAGAAII